MPSFLNLSSINMSSDIVFFICLFIVFTAIAMYFGKGRVIAMILAFYPAVLLYTTFSFAQKLTFLKEGQLLTVNQIGIFLLFFIPLHIIINRYVFSMSEYTGTGNLLNASGMALALLVLILIFSYTVVSLDSLHNFSASIDKLFAYPNAIFYWNVAPLVLLAIL